MLHLETSPLLNGTGTAPFESQDHVVAARNIRRTILRPDSSCKLMQSSLFEIKLVREN